MKYFEITQETDSKIIGKYPQLKELKIDFHKARGEQWAKVSSWKDDDDLPDLDQFLLHLKSKLTDSMSSNFISESSGMIISKRFYEILQNFKVYGQYKSATIHVGKVKHEYYLLWYEYGAKSKINWNASKFIEFYNTYNKETQKYGDMITINDFEDYCNKARTLRERDILWKIVPTEFHLDENFDLTPMYFGSLMCNEKLKNALEENDITGLRFKEIESEIRWSINDKEISVETKNKPEVKLPEKIIKNPKSKITDKKEKAKTKPENKTKKPKQKIKNENEMKEDINSWLEKNRADIKKQKEELIKYWAEKLSYYDSDADKFKSLELTDEHVAFLALLKSKYSGIYNEIIDDLMDNISDFYYGEETFEVAIPYNIELPKEDSKFIWVFCFEVEGTLEILRANFEGWYYMGANISD